MAIKQKALNTAIKMAHVQGKSDGTPSEAQLALINQYTMKDLAAEDVYVRQFVAAHTGLDRDGEIISDALLKDISDTLPSRGMFIKHPGSQDGSSAPGIGKWFEAEIKTHSLAEARAILDEDVQFAPNATTAKLLYASAYIPRTEKHADTIADIDAGVAGFVSASFSYAQPIAIKHEGEVVGYELPAPGEAFEASLVWLGAQQGARAIKSANPNQHEENPVEFEELKLAHKTLQTEKTGLQAQLTAEKTAKESAETKLKAYTDVLDGHSPQEIKGVIDEQAKTKNALIDTLVAFDRTAKKCGDDEPAIKAAKTQYATYPMDALQQLDAANKAANQNGKGIEGGDPNDQSNADNQNNALKACPI